MGRRWYVPSELWERQPRGRRRQCGQSKPKLPMGKIIVAGQLSAPGRPAPGRRIRRFSFPRRLRGGKHAKYGMLSLCLSVCLSYTSVRLFVWQLPHYLPSVPAGEKKSMSPTGFAETPRRPHPWLETCSFGWPPSWNRSEARKRLACILPAVLPSNQTAGGPRHWILPCADEKTFGT